VERRYNERPATQRIGESIDRFLTDCICSCHSDFLVDRRLVVADTCVHARSRSFLHDRRRAVKIEGAWCIQGTEGSVLPRVLGRHPRLARRDMASQQAVSRPRAPVDCAVHLVAWWDRSRPLVAQVARWKSVRRTVGSGRESKKWT